MNLKINFGLIKQSIINENNQCNWYRINGNNQCKTTQEYNAHITGSKNKLN